jgi:hypothetical protein
VAAAADPAGRGDRVLPHPGDRLPRLVRRRARAVELHHLRRRVPLRAGRRLRLLLRARTPPLREAAVPHAAGRAAQRGFLHLGPAVAAVDVHPAGRDVPGRGGARFQPADPAASAGQLRRSRRPRPAVRLLARPRRRPGTVLAGLPAVPHLHPARPGGLRLDREARLPGPGGRAGAGRLPGGLRPAGLPARAGTRGRLGAGPGRPGHRLGQAAGRGKAGRGKGQGTEQRCSRPAVHGQRDRDPAPPGDIRHLRLAVPAAATEPDPGGSRAGLSRDRQAPVSRYPGGPASLIG